MFGLYGEPPAGKDPKANNIWPVTIITARYGGGYEGGKWLAFNVEFDDVPKDVYGSDILCAQFFEEYDRSNKKKNQLKIGRGFTPDEALKNMVAEYYIHEKNYNGTDCSGIS